MVNFLPAAQLLSIKRWLMRKYRFPDFLRTRVQACLTLLWTVQLPILQPCSPASLVADTLLKVLGEHASRFTYVDFCSGAGGPTLAIEKEFNARLAAAAAASTTPKAPSHEPNHKSDALSSSDGEEYAVLTPQISPTGSSMNLVQRPGKGHQPNTAAFLPGSEKVGQAHFVLTDIAPHLLAWKAAAEQSPQISYVPESIDAASASPKLLLSVAPSPLPLSASNSPIFRLFSLAFHHFDEPLAERILANTIDTSAGFAILELQGRNISSQILTFLLFPLLLVISVVFFWHDPVHMLFTYLLPIVPAVVALDGMISSLRTRTGEEVKAMLEKVLREKGRDVDEWNVMWGSEWHTWPLGEMSWIVGLRKTDDRI